MMPRMAGDDTTARGDDPAALLVTLDPERPEPLRRQLAGELREAIRAGRLRTGVRLPASRALAEQLGVSRGVVTDAYEQLGAEGWLAARRGAGTVVAAAPAIAAPPPAPPRRDRGAVRLHPDDARRLAVPAPHLGARDRPRMRRGAPDADLDYGSGLGAAALREALAAYLGRVRATAAEPGGIVVTPATARASGSSRVLADAGRAGSGWRTRRSPTTGSAARAPGWRPSPVPVDGDGAARRRARRAGADAVVVTPSHQFPTGAVMGPERRHALLAWARAATGSWSRTTTTPSSATTAPARRAPGARPRARRVPRHGVEVARAGAAARLDRSPRPGSRPRWRRRSWPPTPAPPRSTSSPSRT